MYKLQELLKDHQMFHSEFQQDNFITKRAGGTLYGQYKQSLRELDSRIEGLKSNYYRREKLQIEIEELNEKIRRAERKIFKRPSKYKLAKWKLNLKQKVLQLESVVRTTADTEREFKRFYSQAIYLKGLLVQKYGELTEEIKNKLDQEMWLFKTKEAIAIDLVTYGRLLNTTYEMVVSLPDSMKEQIFSDLKKGNIPDWYESLDNDFFKGKLPNLTDTDVFTLLKNENLLLE